MITPKELVLVAYAVVLTIIFIRNTTRNHKRVRVVHMYTEDIDYPIREYRVVVAELEDPSNTHTIFVTEDMYRNTSRGQIITAKV